MCIHNNITIYYNMSILLVPNKLGVSIIVILLIFQVLEIIQKLIIALTIIFFFHKNYT